MTKDAVPRWISGWKWCRDPSSRCALRRTGPACWGTRCGCWTETFSCECDSRGSFEVAFKGEGLIAIRECQVGFENPRSIPLRVHGFACIVFGKTLAEVFREACVNLPGRGLAAEEVNVVHGLPFWAKHAR